jgi:hypothetical protein
MSMIMVIPLQPKSTNTARADAVMTMAATMTDSTTSEIADRLRAALDMA